MRSPSSEGSRSGRSGRGRPWPRVGASKSWSRRCPPGRTTFHGSLPTRHDGFACSRPRFTRLCSPTRTAGRTLSHQQSSRGKTTSAAGSSAPSTQIGWSARRLWRPGRVSSSRATTSSASRGTRRSSCITSVALFFHLTDPTPPIRPLAPAKPMPWTSRRRSPVHGSGLRLSKRSRTSCARTVDRPSKETPRSKTISATKSSGPRSIRLSKRSRAYEGPSGLCSRLCQSFRVRLFLSKTCRSC